MKKNLSTIIFSIFLLEGVVFAGFWPNLRHNSTFWCSPAGPSPKGIVLKRSALLKNAVLEPWAPRGPLEAAAAVGKPGPTGAFLKRSAL